VSTINTYSTIEERSQSVAETISALSAILNGGSVMVLFLNFKKEKLKDLRFHA
jgi:hypothetical protein